MIQIGLMICPLTKRELCAGRARAILLYHLRHRQLCALS